MCKYLEYPYSLYLLVRTVRGISNTGTEIHLLFYYHMYGLYVVHVVNNVILILVKLSIIFLTHTLWCVIHPQDHT
jgi:hypothetical protein